MDYFAILKKAYLITRKNRYLWIFGVLLGGAAFTGIKAYNLDFPAEWQNNFIGSGSSTFESFLNNYWQAIVIVAVVVALIVLFFIILAIVSEGALLGSVEAISKGKNHNFRVGFAYGFKRFWRVLGVKILVALIILLTLVTLIGPVIVFVITKAYFLAVFYGLFMFLVSLAIWVFLGLMGPYIMRMAILGDQSPFMAISESWNFFKKHVLDIIVIFFIMTAVGVVVSFAIMFAVVLLGALLAAIGAAIYLISHAACVIYAILVAILVVFSIIVINGILQTFASSVFTLVFLELKEMNIKKP